MWVSGCCSSTVLATYSSAQRASCLQLTWAASFPISLLLQGRERCQSYLAFSWSCLWQLDFYYRTWGCFKLLGSVWRPTGCLGWRCQTRPHITWPQPPGPACVSMPQRGLVCPLGSQVSVIRGCLRLLELILRADFASVWWIDNPYTSPHIWPSFIRRSPFGERWDVYQHPWADSTHLNLDSVKC